MPATADTGRPTDLTPHRRVELERVNAEVNKSIAPQRQSEPPEREKWEIAPAAGDCNDYVVTKRHLLLKQGWPKRALLMTEVVLPSGTHHLVLIARTDEGDLVLDNLSGAVRPVSQVGRAYRWVRMESPQNTQYWNKVERSL